jgi:Fur family ferric uptake transcriptional regulator
MKTISYNTKGRQALIDLLEKHADTTLSADEIHQLLEDKGIDLNLTTIYRNLDRLSEESKILKFPATDGHKAYYQIQPCLTCNEHLHLQCSRCGKVIHLDCRFMQQFVKHISEQHGFDLTCDNSILFGLCEACKKELAEESKKK